MTAVLPDRSARSDRDRHDAAGPAPQDGRGQRTTHKIRPSWARFARRGSVVVALVAVWQLSAALGILKPGVLASPLAVLEYLWNSLSTGQLLTDLAASLRRVVFGLAIGVSAGTVLGLLAGLSRMAEDIVDTPLQMLRALPFLGLAPLLMIWLGIDEGLKVGLVVVGVVFPIYLNLFKGITGVDPKYYELSIAQGLSRSQLIRHIVIPAALPSYLIGLRYSLAMAWLSLVVGEAVNAQAGIGFILQQGKDFLRTDMIVAALVVYAVLGVAIEGVVRLLERFLLPWQQDFRK